VGDVETTVGGTLHGTEDAGTGGGAGETDVKEDLEGAALLTVDLSGLGHGELAISLLDAGEGLVELELLEGAAGKEKTGSVGGSPVGETVGDAVGLELVGVGGGEDAVTSDLGGDDLLPSWSEMRTALGESVSHTQMMSLLVKRTTSLYLGALYLFFAWVIKRLRA
jgi:hypothetical protein